MATAGKKGKKAKGKTVSLNDFLNVGGASEDGKIVVAAQPSSWADEMDEYDEAPYRGTEQFVLPTAPRAARGPDISDDRIPRDPPYTAYVANLAYDIDEQDVVKFFNRLKIKGVRLPRDGDPETGRLKGFGYADFEDRDSLVEALTMNDLLLKNRKVRIDLATHAGRGDREQHGGGGRDGGDRRGGGRYDDGGDDRTAGDWRSGPPAAPRDDGRKDRYEPPRDRDDRRDDRRDNRGYGFGERREGGFDRGDRSSGFDRDRRDGGFDRDRRDGHDRDGGDRRRDGGGFDRYERGGSSGGDRYERRGGYDRSDRRSPEREAPRERPKLQLSKRTVAEEEQKEAAAAAQSSIFGGAKPVDTTKREKEIEEKLKKPHPVESRAHKDEGFEDGHHKEEGPSSHHEDEAASEVHKDDEDHKPAKPKAASIFGQAKPVDTTAREKEIEERLRKKSTEEKPEVENGERASGERKKLVLTRSGEGKDSHHEIHSGHDRPSQDRRGPRSHHDDDRNHARGGGHHGDRDGPRRVDRDRDGGRGPVRRDNPPPQDRRAKHDRSTPPPPKKFEEKPPPNFAADNKFAFLQDSEEVGSGQDSE